MHRGLWQRCQAAEEIGPSGILRGPVVREQQCFGCALLREKIRRMPRH